MWIVNAIIFHILWLGSIFVIYFRSPVIKGLQPQSSLIFSNQVPPANRVVLIVADGLRAESFFRNDCGELPYIRRLIQRQGLVGISRTHVPTESRPGHIAMIAGLFEDPSAVTRGWKKNPIDFDTVFNRSSYTYAWGANDVLHIFSRVTSEERMFIDAYDHDLDFSGRDNTSELDEWVFKRVKFYIGRKKDDLRQQRKIIFFLHLLGLDSAGHIHKPNSKLFLENLHQTDKGIYHICKEFEQIFPDGKTAFLLTSDHGMTNSGSHGGGNPHETDTPFFFWGAGVADKSISNADADTKHTFEAANMTLPLHEIEQIQIASFISALIGVSPPMNNFGTLPKNLMNVTLEYYALAAHSNALQLLEQFSFLLKEFQRGRFVDFLPSFEKLNTAKIFAYHKISDEFFHMKRFKDAFDSSYEIMHLAVEGIDYYHSYYKNVLLLSTTIAMVGWLLYLYQLLTKKNCTKGRFEISTASLILLLIGFVLFVFLILQRVPLVISFYIMLPIFCWFLPLQQMTDFKTIMKIRLNSLLTFLFFILCIELMVLCFFYRQFISVQFLLYNFYHTYPKLRSKNKSVRFCWLSLVVILSVFPLLPPSVGYKNGLLTVIGALMIIGRNYLMKSGLSLKFKLISWFGILNALICMYQHSQYIRISVVSQIISWLFLMYSFLHLFFNNLHILEDRVELIFFNLSALYVSLCTSYEPIFVILLGSELILSLSAEKLQFPNSIIDSTSSKLEKSTYDIQTRFQFAFCIILYTFFSFFGTGNIASVSSFDPNIIRCFLTTFSPFMIMLLVILKLIIPVFINISLIFGISEFARTHVRSIFICLLFICNCMGLHFLYLVRNQGSWMEIGSSISHFVIMQITTVVLLILTFVAKFLLQLVNLNILHFKVKLRNC